MDIGQLNTIASGLTALFASVFTPGTPDQNELHRLNAKINALPNVSDESNYGQKNYWATPKELMAKGAGDSEDKAIAKMFELIKQGKKENSLRVVRVNRNESKSNTAEIEEDYVLIWKKDNTELVFDHKSDVVYELHSSAQKMLMPDQISYRLNRFSMVPANLSGFKKSGDDFSLWISMLKRYRTENNLYGDIFPGPNGMEVVAKVNYR